MVIRNGTDGRTMKLSRRLKVITRTRTVRHQANAKLYMPKR